MLAHILGLLPERLLWLGAERYIAGPEVSDAVRVVRKLNDAGATATMSLLGEHVTTDSAAGDSLNEYQRLLDVVVDEQLEAYVSVKPTSLGLTVDYHRYLERLKCLAAEAELRSIFVRLDMEEASGVEGALRSFRAVRRRRANIGVVLQAHLRRSIRDAELLTAEGADVRLCKGAYRESRSKAYRNRFDVQRSYIRILRTLLKGNGSVAIATHDEHLLKHAEYMVKQLCIPADRYSFEMLYGVREARRAELITAGHPVGVYVPYGAAWRAYSLRRLNEHPQLLWTIARAALLGK